MQTEQTYEEAMDHMNLMVLLACNNLKEVSAWRVSDHAKSNAQLDVTRKCEKQAAMHQRIKRDGKRKSPQAGIHAIKGNCALHDTLYENVAMSMMGYGETPKPCKQLHDKGFVMRGAANEFLPYYIIGKAISHISCRFHFYTIVLEKLSLAKYSYIANADLLVTVVFAHKLSRTQSLVWKKIKREEKKKAALTGFLWTMPEVEPSVVLKEELMQNQIYLEPQAVASKGCYVHKTDLEAAQDLMERFDRPGWSKISVEDNLMLHKSIICTNSSVRRFVSQHKNQVGSVSYTAILHDFLGCDVTYMLNAFGLEW